MSNKKIPAEVWQNQTDENIFYYDLLATIDGLYAGVGTKRLTNLWLKRAGYRLNWRTFELIEINKATEQKSKKSYEVFNS